MRRRVMAHRYGAGPQAIFCRDGRRDDPVPLEDGVEVEDATEADLAHVPSGVPQVLVADMRLLSGKVVTKVGIYRIPDRGVAAIYGCDLVDVDPQCSPSQSVEGLR
jgi:hypothetical protein